MPYKWKDDQKAYQKAYHAKWYKKNKKKVDEQKKKLRAERVEWFEGLKADLSCEKCGFAHPAALDFHHRDPSKKEFVLSDPHRRDWSKDRVLKEMKKCDVLCSNCHRIHHWDNRGMNKE